MVVKVCAASCRCRSQRSPRVPKRRWAVQHLWGSCCRSPWGCGREEGRDNRQPALPCSSGQDRLPCSSDVGSFLISWNALLLHKGSFCFFSVAFPKWDLLLLPSRWLFCLLSNLFIQMGLIFVWRAHYPEDKSYCWMGALIYWMLKMMHNVYWNCLKLHACLKISYKEMHLRWLLHLLVFSWTAEYKFAYLFRTLPFAFFSFDPVCSRGRWYRPPVHSLQPGWELLVSSGGGCSGTAGCSPPSWGQKGCTHLALAQKTAALLHTEGICTRAWLLLGPGVGCFFISNVNLKGSWAVATVFWAILEICSEWAKAAAEPWVTSSTQ